MRQINEKSNNEIVCDDGRTIIFAYHFFILSEFFEYKKTSYIMVVATIKLYVGHDGSIMPTCHLRHIRLRCK